MDYISRERAKKNRQLRKSILYQRRNRRLIANPFNVTEVAQSRRRDLAREARQRRLNILSLRRNINTQRQHNNFVSHSVVDENGDVTTTTNLRDSVLFNDDTHSTRSSVEVFDFGNPTNICSYCGAIVWYEERKGKSKGTTNPKFTLCCQEGKVKLPLLKDAPQFLKKLLDYNEGPRSSKFRENIRSYNSMFAFTSMGGRVDNTINNGNAPYVFRLNGQNHHKIGSLLPMDGATPKFAQLYIYDTANELTNRMNVLQRNNSTRHLDREVVEGIMKMLDENNELAKVFRMARDRYEESDLIQVRLRIIGARPRDGRQYNMPTSSEVAALIVGNGYEDNGHRDIIVEEKNAGLRRINELHPTFMAMQYPLLFPYAEDGFTLNIPYHNVQGRSQRKQKYVTMREYYAFRIQQRANEGQTLLRGGRLYQQYLVDAYAYIEENRLNWVRNNQTKIISELYSGLRDAVVASDTTPASVGKRLVLPSSFTGGPRYMAQNYQDAIAICRQTSFTGGTVATPINDDDETILRYKFAFVDFEEIPSRLYLNKHTTDVIGKLIRLAHIEHIHMGNGKTVSKRDITIQNERGLTMKVTLWGEIVNQIKEESIPDPSHPTSYIVLVATSTIVKKFKGEHFLSSSTATKLYLNLHNPQTNEFKERCKSDGTIEILQPATTSPVAKKDDPFENRKTIYEMGEIIKRYFHTGSTRYTCAATIFEIKYDHGWYYLSCQQCTKKISKNEDKTWCYECRKEVQYIIPRYMVKVRVKDHTGYAIFTIFDKEAEKLIDRPVTQLCEMLEKENGKEAVELILEKILYSVHVFQLKLNDYNPRYGDKTYTALKLLEYDEEKENDFSSKCLHKGKKRKISEDGPTNTSLNKSPNNEHEYDSQEDTLGICSPQKHCKRFRFEE